MRCHKIKTVDISIILCEAIRRTYNKESMAFLFKDIALEDWLGWENGDMKMDRSVYLIDFLFKLYLGQYYIVYGYYFVILLSISMDLQDFTSLY